MPTVTARVLPLAAVLLVGLSSPAWVLAQNTNTTIQEGKVNINHTFQCGDSNDNATYQAGKVNINHTRQRCGDSRNQTGQFGDVNHNRTDQGRGTLMSESRRQGGHGRGGAKR